MNGENRFIIKNTARTVRNRKILPENIFTVSLSAPGFSFYEDDSGKYGTYTNGKLEIECINREHAVQWDIFQVRIQTAEILFLNQYFKGCLGKLWRLS